MVKYLFHEHGVEFTDEELQPGACMYLLPYLYLGEPLIFYPKERVVVRDEEGNTLSPRCGFDSYIGSLTCPAWN